MYKKLNKKYKFVEVCENERMIFQDNIEIELRNI